MTGAGAEAGVEIMDKGGAGAGIWLELEPEPEISKMGGSGNPVRKGILTNSFWS